MGGRAERLARGVAAAFRTTSIKYRSGFRYLSIYGLCGVGARKEWGMRRGEMIVLVRGCDHMKLAPAGAGGPLPHAHKEGTRAEGTRTVHRVAAAKGAEAVGVRRRRGSVAEGVGGGAGFAPGGRKPRGSAPVPPATRIPASEPPTHPLSELLIGRVAWGPASARVARARPRVCCGREQPPAGCQASARPRSAVYHSID